MHMQDRSGSVLDSPPLLEDISQDTILRCVGFVLTSTDEDKSEERASSMALLVSQPQLPKGKQADVSLSQPAFTVCPSVYEMATN